MPKGLSFAQGELGEQSTWIVNLEHNLANLEEM